MPIVCIFELADNGEKRRRVISTRPLPTNGGLKLIGQCIPSIGGIRPRLPRPRVKDRNLKGDAELFCFDVSSTGESKRQVSS